MKKRLLLLPISTLLLFGCSRNATPTYTVTWLNYDGTELEVDLKVKKNSMPQYDGETPVRQQDAQYTYTFSGWDKELEKVKSDVTYTATYSHQIRSYTIIWVVEGNTVKTETLEYGATPVFGANPTKDSTQEHTYTFTGWSPEVTTVTGDATYTAQFREDVRQYTVSWVVEGNTVREDSVGYGSCPVWGSSDPSKDSTEQYSYTFDGWDRDLSIPITGDVTIHGSYTAHIRSYNVKFLDNDGNILSNQTLEYGATPSCDYEFSVKSDYYYNYGFSHWDHEIEYVTGDATYVAVYTQCPCNFIDNGNGTMYVSGLKNSEYQGEVVIPETWCGSTVTGIGSGAFRNARGVTRVVVPDTITGIGSAAFYNCGLTSIDLSKTQLTTLKSTTFMNCDNLTEALLPDTLQTIESECFRLCKVLHHVVFPDSIRSIGDYAFEQCCQLYSLQFGPSYQSSYLGNAVFESCGALTEVVYTGSSIEGVNGNPRAELKSVIGTQNKGQFKAYEPQNGDVTIMTYKAIDSNEEVVVGQYGKGTSLYLDGTREIKNYAFYDNPYIEDIHIAVNSTNASIGQNAFGGNETLKTVSFSSTVDFDIPSYCFRDCTELESVDFGEARVKRIGELAFASCSKLTGVSLPNTVVSIGVEAFNGCALTSCYIPASLTSMASNPFIKNPITSFGVDPNNTAFTVDHGILFSKDMTKLVAYPGASTTEVYTVPSGITTLGRFCLAYVDALKKVYLPASVTQMVQQWLIASNNVTELHFAGTVEQCGEILGVQGWWRSWDQQQTLKYIICSDGNFNL